MTHLSCIILVPFGSHIEPRCEQALSTLERKGYAVRRVQGFSAIDFGRCVLASAALAEGFQEILWIDSDIIFHPSDVDRLRDHHFPLVCGIYAKKSQREFACDFIPGTEKIVFGKGGGLHEVLYTGMGFCLTHRDVYETMRQQLQLPECNQRFGQAIVPYFLPMLIPDGKGWRYLTEDYAFCERARQCGFKILSDSAIRLWHVGSYRFGWEDVGYDKPQYGTMNMNFNWQKPPECLQ